MIGLGVGIDYALFIVTRYREALRAARTRRGARSLHGDGHRRAARCCSPACTVVHRAARHVRCSASRFLYGVAIAASIGVLLTCSPR